MNTKPIYQSKTAWLQVITLIAAFFPQVQAFLIAHPQAAITGLGLLNVAVRIVTSGKITIFADGTDPAANNSVNIPAWVFTALTGSAAAGIIGFSLPSCSPDSSSAAWAAMKSVPIKTRVVTDYGVACYSSKSGLSVEVDAESGK